MNADLLASVTNLVHALAWPVVVLIAMWRFRTELRGLVGRFRRGAGLEFDPPPAQGRNEPAPRTTLPPVANVPALPPSAAAFLQEVRNAPGFQTITDAQRVEQLLYWVAFLSFSADGERVEGQIWESQLAVLEYLNAVGEAGAAVADLKVRFYDGAAERYPLLFANYPVENYLAFLQTQDLITTAAGVARITQRGRDYLAWRVQVRKPPRVVG